MSWGGPKPAEYWDERRPTTLKPRLSNTPKIGESVKSYWTRRVSLSHEPHGIGPSSDSISSYRVYTATAAVSFGELTVPESPNDSRVSILTQQLQWQSGDRKRGVPNDEGPRARVAGTKPPRSTDWLPVGRGLSLHSTGRGIESPGST
jgi:hypothetical protein